MFKKILVSGYSYVDPAALKTFDDYPSKENIYFLVPERWPFKKGKFVLYPTKGNNVRTAKAFFHHSDYPLIGGILKGWMPIFPIVFFQQKPDIVYSASELNLLTTLYQGFFAKIFARKHIIFTWENIPYDKFKGVKGFIQKVVIKLNLAFCDGLICGSEKGQQMINELTDSPTATIPICGVDTEFLTPDHSQKIFKGTDYRGSLVFSFAGAIGYRKGIHLIIKAFSDIYRSIPNSVLLIAGSGEYEEEISSLIKENGLDRVVKRISWLGREELKEFFNASDIFLYPSIPYQGWEEQFGYSIAEASSMELPVITTKSGSISEVVINNETGILVEPDNLEDLKKAILDLANDKEKRIRLGKAGRKFIMENYANRAVALKYFDFFNSF